MTINNLVWVGLCCCLAALMIQVFPDAAFRIGVDVGASWRVFGFGVFLIVVSAVMSIGARRCDHRR